MLLVSILGWLFGPSTLLASTVLAVDTATLVARADTIVVASVMKMSAFRGADGNIHTRVDMQVHQGLRHAHEGDTLALDILGGTLAGQTDEVPGAPTLRPGDLVVAFLETHGAYRRPLGMRYGIFYVTRDAQGHYQAIRDIAGLALVPAGAANGPGDHIMPLATLTQTIRSHLPKVHGGAP